MKYRISTRSGLALLVGLTAFANGAGAAAALSPGAQPATREVKIDHNQLVIDGQTQPQLFGAEVQYFRLRGGYEPNQPRAKVIALWNKALDHAVEAKMNAVSFYIPWDFHEYAEGKFDFTGTVDEDGDGNPDYPSRDVVTFFKLVEQHGIKRIMVRPGPYINAEWGYLGFGAIPSWFHEKFPNSHMMSSDGLRTKLFDYANPDLLKYTRRWFTALYSQVLKPQMGVGKPIVFLQLDNETNFQWQSLYSGDYSPSAVSRYQTFLQNTYVDLSAVNQAHHRQWADWSAVKPPVVSADSPLGNRAESRDWYRFADQTIGDYLHEIRKIWESLGVQEPEVIFTEAESYNAPEDGLLPNFVMKNAPTTTGMMTVNLYPKTFETPDFALLNNPFKADLDTKAVDSANDAYLGSHQEWAMGPEIQGGWWKGIGVSDESRRQTYLTVIGHGMKSFFIYYFNEGDNFGDEWSLDRIQPIFDRLRHEWGLDSTPVKKLSNAFWGELQARTDHQVLVGFDARTLMEMTNADREGQKQLYFDAPLNGDANPSSHFALLKRIGTQVISPHQDFLSRSLEVQDPVGFIKDSVSHAPGPDSRINSLWANSDWSAGLVGCLLNADVNPVILHGDLTPEDAFVKPKVLMHLDTAQSAERTTRLIKLAHARGQTIINFISDATTRELGFDAHAAFVGYEPRKIFAKSQLDRPDMNPHAAPGQREDVMYYISSDGHLRSGSEPDAKPVMMKANGPLFVYSATELAALGCSGILYWNTEIVGYRCGTRAGTPQGPGAGAVVQIGALLFDDYNSSAYGQMGDSVERRQFTQNLLNDSGVQPQLSVSPEAQMTAAFARKDPQQELLWITAKTGARFEQDLKLRVSETLLTEGLKPSARFTIQNLLPETGDEVMQTLTRQELVNQGFRLQLKGDGSTVYKVEIAQ